jgi:nucleoside-diphosphate kinase
MKSKLIPIPYTIGILKPHLALNEEKTAEIMQKVEENHFEIFHSKRKILTKQEVENLFAVHRNRTYFEEIKEHMMTGESLVLLLINARETYWDEEKEMDVREEDPITRWKKLLGDKDPEVAKTETPDGLRAKYGASIIKNGFYCSDDPKNANKDRDIFLFPVPEKPPVFQFVRTKVTLQTILKFLFPPNLEHSNSTGRLDLFALYGPVCNYHSVDKCFCSKCIKVAKLRLSETIAEKAAAERKRLGMTADVSLGSTSVKGGSKTTSK